jgi:beta-glucosidase
MGLADMLLARPGRGFDFTGRLPFDWPAGDCLPAAGGAQFRRGYGLSLRSRSTLGRLAEFAPVVACPADSR